MLVVIAAFRDVSQTAFSVVFLQQDLGTEYDNFAAEIAKSINPLPLALFSLLLE